MFESLAPDPGQEALSRAARLFIVIAALGALASVLQLLAVVSAPSGESVLVLALMAVQALLAYVTARGIEAQRPWAKRLAYVQGILLIANVPIGSLVGAFVLIYVYRASRAGVFAEMVTTAASVSSRMPPA